MARENSRAYPGWSNHFTPRSGRPFIVILILVMILVIPGIAQSRTSNQIAKGSAFLETVTINFPEGGGRDASLSLYMPGQGPISKASLKLEPVPGPDHPNRVSVDIGLDGREDWAFGGGIEGSFGRQTVFSDGEETRRLPLTSKGSLISFFLPIGMDVTDGSMGIISLPQPKGDFRSSLISGPIERPSPDMVDSGDLDGDGDDEIVYYSEASSSIEMVSRNGSGVFSISKLADSNGPITSVRVMQRGMENSGFIVYSGQDEDGSSSRISLIVFDDEGGYSKHVIASDLPLDSLGFSLDRAKDSYNLFTLDNSQGRIMNVTVNSTGGVNVREMIDRSIPSSCLAQGDLDGDGLKDLLLFPLEGSGKNITLMKGDVIGGISSFVPIDMNLTGSAVSLPLGVDANGDGSDEVYLMMGDPASLSVLSVSEDGIDRFSIGFNGTLGSLRTSPRYHDLYAGPEDLLYMVTGDGLYQIIPETDPGGIYYNWRSPSFTELTVIGSFDELGKGLGYHFSSSHGISTYDLRWGPVGEVEVMEASGTGYIRNQLSHGSIIRAEVGELDLYGKDGAQYIDDYGNVLVRCDLMISGQGGTASIQSLDLRYEGSLDASSSEGFLSAVSRGAATFGDRVPFFLISDSPGAVQVGPVEVIYDSPPSIDEQILNDIHIDEGSLDMPILYIWELIDDDYMMPQDLGISLHTREEYTQRILYLHDGVLRANAQSYPDLVGDLHFQLSVSDGKNTITTPEITLILDPVEDRPRPLTPPDGMIIYEGEEDDIDLSTLFIDPDGDDIHHAYSLLYTQPPSLEAYITATLEGDILTISPDRKGNGGLVCIQVSAWDDHHGPGNPTSLDFCVLIEDVDSLPYLGQNPGPVIMSEDQDDPTRVPLNGWFMDPDTPLSGYTIEILTLYDTLDTSTIFFSDEPYLILYPKPDFTGTAYLQVRMFDQENELSDWLEIEVEPVNDPPEVVYGEKEVVDGVGWEITGEVIDIDSPAGTVEYRVDDSGWMRAKGWSRWSIYVPFDMVPTYGVYLFIKADDGEGTLGMEMIRLVVPEEYGVERSDLDGDGIPDIMDAFPYDPDEWVDTDADGVGVDADVFPYNPDEWVDTDADGIGDNSDWDPFDPHIRTEADTMIAPGSEPEDGGGGTIPIGAILLGLGLSGLIGFILFTEVGMVLVATLGANLYSKLSKKDILNHEVRGLIRGYIIANPGDHYSSIRRNLDLNNGTLAYHLRVLEQNQYIKSFFDGIFKRYYPSNVNIQKVQRNISKQEEIFNIILEFPGVTMEDIGNRIGVSRQVVNYHVKNLIRAGMITYSRDSKSSRFYPAEDDIEGLQKRRLKGEV